LIAHKLIIMRIFIFQILCLLVLVPVNAQNLEITYRATVRQTLPDDERKEFLVNDFMRAQLKQNEEPDPCEYKMVISGKESSFTYVEKISNHQDPNAPVIRVAPAGFGTTYKNLSDSTVRKDFDVYDKKYFSLDPLQKYDWKITKEKKEILGFEARKAIAEDSTAIYTAWYAPKLSFPDGPADYWGLPGLILEAEKSSKSMVYEQTYIAESIQSFDKKLKIIKPGRGTQIKANEIDGIWDEVNKRRNEIWNDPQGVEKD